MTDTVTWRELLAEATQRLDDAGGANDARRIIEEASGVRAAELALVLDEPVTERGVMRFDSMVARRAGGEPLQYVLGRWGFRELDLMVDDRVLIPRPETEQVVEFALAELDRSGARDQPTYAVDLGTGSGAIALSIAQERVRSHVWATDSSAEALEVATANLAGIGRAAARVALVQGSWYAALSDDLLGRFDLVVSNPPYVPTGAAVPGDVRDWEPASALFAGEDGLDDVREIIAEAPAWLMPHGALVCEISPEQADEVSAIAQRYFAEVEIRNDLTGRARALVARFAR